MGQRPRESLGIESRFNPSNEDSGLVSVLSLWPLAKVSDPKEASDHPPGTHRHLRFVQEILLLGQSWLSAIRIVFGGV